MARAWRNPNTSQITMLHEHEGHDPSDLYVKAKFAKVHIKTSALETTKPPRQLLIDAKRTNGAVPVTLAGRIIMYTVVS